MIGAVCAFCCTKRDNGAQIKFSPLAPPARYSLMFIAHSCLPASCISRGVFGWGAQALMVSQPHFKSAVALPSGVW